jgi:myo-inositol-1(or 4)-monophosphatase
MVSQLGNSPDSSNLFNLSNLNDLQKFLDIATIAARTGGAVLKSYWGKLKEINEKQPGDLITAADKESEAKVLATIERHLPNHAILAEESGGASLGEHQFLWVVDPLDGTTNFAHQYPFSSVSVGLLIDNVPAVGAIYDPFRDELFCAAKNLGAFCEQAGDRRVIKVANNQTLDRSILVTGFAYDRRKTNDNNYAEFCHFTHLTQGVRRGGSAALDLAYVACGRVDGFWERGLSIWDMAAGIIIAREAGAIVTAYDGSALDLSSGRILATNAHLHPQMVDELAQVAPLSEQFPMRK